MQINAKIFLKLTFGSPFEFSVFKYEPDKVQQKLCILVKAPKGVITYESGSLYDLKQ